MISGFLSGHKYGIFIDSTDEDDYADDEDDSNPTNSSINPIRRQTKSKKNKKYSREKSKHPSTTNSAIKYQNNKKKKRKNVKSIKPTPKVCDSNKGRMLPRSIPGYQKKFHTTKKYEGHEKDGQSNKVGMGSK